MKRHNLFAVFSSLALAAACSSSPTTDDGGTDATTDGTQQNDSSQNDSSTKDGSSNDSASNDASDASTTSDASDAGDGAAKFTLTIQDYLAWCSVTVNGGAPSTSTTQTFQFAPNTSVTVHGDTASAGAFYWGYWGNVAPDGGLADGGEDLSKTVSFAITRDMTLNACCPDVGQPLTQCTF